MYVCVWVVGVVVYEWSILTHCGVSVGHQNDHGNGARIDQALILCLHKHLHRLQQSLVDVGAWSQYKILEKEKKLILFY